MPIKVTLTPLTGARTASADTPPAHCHLLELEPGCVLLLDCGWDGDPASLDALAAALEVAAPRMRPPTFAARVKKGATTVSRKRRCLPSPACSSVPA